MKKLYKTQEEARAKGGDWIGWKSIDDWANDMKDPKVESVTLYGMIRMSDKK